jgi:hypothetical protein
LFVSPWNAADALFFVQVSNSEYETSQITSQVGTIKGRAAYGWRGDGLAGPADVDPAYYGLSAVLIPSWWNSHQERGVSSSLRKGRETDPKGPMFVSSERPQHSPYNGIESGRRGEHIKSRRPLPGLGYTESERYSRISTLSTLSSDYGTNQWSDYGSYDGYSDTETDSSFDSDIESYYSVG